MRERMGVMALSSSMLILGGCGTAATQTDLFEQQGTYLGDNSSVRDIVQQLPHGDQLKKMELSTKDKPYQLTLRYAGYEEGQVEQKSNRSAIYNATALFTLIPNVDQVNMTIEDASYHFTEFTSEKAHSFRGGMIASSGTGCLQTPHVPDCSS